MKKKLGIVVLMVALTLSVLTLSACIPSPLDIIFPPKDEQPQDEPQGVAEAPAPPAEAPAPPVAPAAPKTLGNKLSSGTYKLDGIVYSLPTDYSELNANGWTSVTASSPRRSPTSQCAKAISRTNPCVRL
jgi:hypothetical protein